MIRLSITGNKKDTRNNINARGKTGSEISIVEVAATGRMICDCVVVSHDAIVPLQF